MRRGKATILPNRCIDCGTCIRVCPHKAVKSVPDDFNVLQNFQYNVVVPDPSLYGQFHNLDDHNIVLNGLLELGFDRVYESAAASEFLTSYLRSRPDDLQHKMPELSSACPAVVRLISIRFPDLLGHLAPVICPLEMAAIRARKEAVEETGLAPEEIGVFAVVPCSSLVTVAAHPDGLPFPVMDGAFAVRDIYRALLEPMRRLAENDIQPLAMAGASGISWAFSGGEAKARMDRRYVAVDGIDNVITMLEQIEDGHLPEADFIELRACTEGCLGGCLNVENPFIARTRIKHLIHNLPERQTEYQSEVPIDEMMDVLRRPEFLPTYVLDPDRRKAMEKMQRIQELEAQLPGLRCGSCGAPSCHAFAEDVIMGRANEEDCIFKVREKMQHMAGQTDADEYLPAPFRRRKPGKNPTHPEG